jgi:hypothetical protein
MNKKGFRHGDWRAVAAAKKAPIVNKILEQRKRDQERYTRRPK